MPQADRLPLWEEVERARTFHLAQLAQTGQAAQTVWKFVSIPPSHRVVTNGIPTRAACSEMTSCACFFVPTNRITPPRRPRSLAYA